MDLIEVIKFILVIIGIALSGGGVSFQIFLALHIQQYGLIVIAIILVLTLLDFFGVWIVKEALKL